MIPVTYCYARVSKTLRDEKNLETLLPDLVQCFLRRDLIFVDDDIRITFELLSAAILTPAVTFQHSHSVKGAANAGQWGVEGQDKCPVKCAA